MQNSELFKYRFGLDNVINLFSNKTLLVLCDKHGAILEMLNHDQVTNRSMVEEIFTHRHLKPYFNFGQYKTLDDLPNGMGSLQTTKRFFLFENVDNFYSTLPAVGIKLSRLAENRYVGVILVSDVIPNFFPEKKSSIFFINNNEALVGFNHSFYQIFNQAYKSPGDMLNMQINQFLNPTPAEVQRLFLADFNPEKEEGLNNIYSKDFTQNGLDEQEIVPGEAEITKDRKGLFWQNKGTQLSFLTIANEISLEASDLVVKVELNSIEDHAPVFMLGSGPSGNETPDNHGYLLGKHGFQDGFIIKKEGHVLTCRQIKLLDLKGRHTFYFCKKEHSLFLYMDREKLLDYFDPDFSSSGKAFVTLGLRGGCSCIIESMALSIKKRSARAKQEVPENIIVKLKPPAQGYFTLNRFYNGALSSTHFNVEGYILQDVTGIQHKVEHLRQEHKKHIKREQKLESMLREFQGQQSAFIGSSPKIVSLKEKARVIAGSNATVLLQGATGTGKEVLARYIHANSPYRNGPFVKVDCSTLPRELMESELFGHEKGAFTGAVERKIGMFEQANRGTLFLDEVANLTQEAQTKLLQFLEGFTISRVGGDKPIPLDLRVVAATNVPLQSMVSKGAFREDLYYRLFVVVMNLPVLKDRMEDLPELCSHFLKVFNASANKHIEKITPHAFKKIYTYDWPGNIRELRNVIQRAVLFCEEDEIDGDLITFTSATGGVQERGPEYAGPGKRKREVYHPLARISKTELIKVIKHHKGNVAQLAKRFNLSRRALYYHFERKGIDVSKYRG